MPDKHHNQSCHGVMVSIDGQGVLISGKAGSGKSSLALALVDAGHQLVADDVIEVSSSDGQLYAHCPNMLKGLLHTRELGTMDIEKLYGSEAILESAPIQYVIELSDEPIPESVEGQQRHSHLMHQTLPLLRLSPNNPASAYTRLMTWLKLQHQADASLALKSRQQAQMQQ